MYRCENCGHLFEEGEQVKWTEPHGEKMSGCPICKGSYAETTPCKACGNESFYADELEDGICDDCIEEYSKNFDFCIKIGAEETENVAINGAVASLFNADAINDILVAVAKNIKDVSFETFAEDKSWFAQMIVAEVNEK